MQKPSPKHHQRHLFHPDLLQLSDPNAPLLLLAKHIPRETLENKFAPLYSGTGPCKACAPYARSFDFIAV